MGSVAGAKDLRLVEPRPLDCQLDGYAWIPRMLDKARATLAGTNGIAPNAGRSSPRQSL